MLHTNEGSDASSVWLWMAMLSRCRCRPEGLGYVGKFQEGRVTGSPAISHDT